jgi:hypothetical protein
MKKLFIVGLAILSLATVTSAGDFAGERFSIAAMGFFPSPVSRSGKAHADVSARQRFAQASTSAAIPAVTETAASTDWVAYHDARTGLSFRYPSSLRVHERDPREFGLPDAEVIVDLLGDTTVNPDTIVLRFIVNRGETTPEMAAAKSRSIRERLSSEKDPRESVTFMQLDGHEALVGVGCGRAACRWAVNILQPRECTILSLLAGADSEEALPPPHDGLFPLLTIIQSVHFGASGRSSNTAREAAS